MIFRATKFVIPALLCCHAMVLGQKPSGDVGKVKEGIKRQKLLIGSNSNDTHEIVVQLNDGVDAGQVARDHGLTMVRGSKARDNEFVFGAATVERANAAVDRLAGSSDVGWAVNNQHARYERFAFSPNDPYFANNRFGGQWHLQNNIGNTAGNNPNIDANVTGAWDRNFTGSGVVVGIVDDSVEKNHPDLAPNFRSDLSFDFGQNDNDPSPVNATDRHGVSVAGVAVAKGGNGIGGTGAAPDAELAGLRVDFENQTIQMFRDATLFESQNIPIKNHSYGISAPYVQDTGTDLQADAIRATAADTIHVFAAGNSRGLFDEDTTKSINSSLPETIVVGATGNDGQFSFYSSFGSSLIVTAPSNDTLGITTTDVVGSSGYNGGTGNTDYSGSDTLPTPEDYTATFGGTSSATPVVAGVLALAREANPDMDYRMAKHLLVQTSRVIDPGDNSVTSDGGWRTNAAGNEFNLNYGFGLIDADALVTLANVVAGTTGLQTELTGEIIVEEALPDQGTLTEFFELENELPLEDLLVTMELSHTYAGDLTGFLTSPSGFRSRLFMENIGDAQPFNDDSWTFRTLAFWGESGAGQWELELQDAFGVDVGVWHSFSVEAQFGSLILAVPEPAAAMLSGLAFCVMILRRDRR